MTYYCCDDIDDEVDNEELVARTSPLCSCGARLFTAEGKATGNCITCRTIISDPFSRDPSVERYETDRVYEQGMEFNAFGNEVMYPCSLRC